MRKIDWIGAAAGFCFPFAAMFFVMWGDIGDYWGLCRFYALFSTPFGVLTTKTFFK